MSKKRGTGFLLFAFFLSVLLLSLILAVFAQDEAAGQNTTASDNAFERSDQMRYFVMISVTLLAFVGIIISLVHMLHKIHKRRKEGQKEKVEEKSEEQLQEEEEQQEQYEHDLQDYFDAVNAHERYKEAIKSKSEQRYKVFEAFEEKEEKKPGRQLARDAGKSGETRKELRRKIEKHIRTKIDWVPLESLSDIVFLKLSMLASERKKKEVDKLFEKHKELRKKIIDYAKAKKPDKESEDYIFNRISEISGMRKKT